VVALVAEVFDGPAEQAPLHAALTISDRSTIASISIWAIAAPTSPLRRFLLEPSSAPPWAAHDLQLLRHLGAGDDGVRV